MRYDLGMNNLAHIPTARRDSANVTVARNIKAEMGYVGINQAALAAALNQNEMWLSRRLLSKTAFSTDEVQAIADILGANVGDLFTKRERHTPPVGPTGIEPMTSTVEGQRLATVTPIRRVA